MRPGPGLGLQSAGSETRPVNIQGTRSLEITSPKPIRCPAIESEERREPTQGLPGIHGRARSQPQPRPSPTFLSVLSEVAFIWCNVGDYLFTTCQFLSPVPTIPLFSPRLQTPVSDCPQSQWPLASCPCLASSPDLSSPSSPWPPECAFNLQIDSPTPLLSAQQCVAHRL